MHTKQNYVGFSSRFIVYHIICVNSPLYHIQYVIEVNAWPIMLSIAGKQSTQDRKQKRFPFVSACVVRSHGTCSIIQGWSTVSYYLALILLFLDWFYSRTNWTSELCWIRRIIRTIAKPVAARLMVDAKNHPAVAKICMVCGEGMHQISSRIYILAQGKLPIPVPVLYPTYPTDWIHHPNQLPL